MKKVLMIVTVSLLVSFAYISLRDRDVKSLISAISDQRVYFQKDSQAKFAPDWIASDLLDEINTARESLGLNILAESEKLDQSARARLAVILSDNDVDGTVTGVSREKALTITGYDANLIGELILTNFYKTNDPVVFWNNNETMMDTLYHIDFDDVGVAIKNTVDRVDVYVLFASPRKIVKKVVAPKITWGGLELWEAVNKRRVEMGVNPLKQQAELCTVASIRLNQLLELGKLDGHEGFVPVLQRDDLKWIAEKYNLSEYLIQGYPTATEAVAAWENTLGHRSLLSGGEYVWGCVYAQNTFGVAIAAY